MAQEPANDLTEKFEAISQQLAFQDFFLDKEDYSHTLEFFDFCGAFVHRPKSMKQEKLSIIEENFSHRGHHFIKQIKPAAIVGDDGKTYMSYASKREELVMHALRYMAAQQMLHVGIEEPQSSVALTFSLHQLRKELTKRGHGYKWSELEEAIDVLGSSILKIQYQDGKKKNSWSAPYLSGVQSKDDEKGAGPESLRRVILHPLASLAILKVATRRLNYGRLMELKQPLSRWLYSRMCHYATNASHWRPFSDKSAIGFRFTLAEVLEQSGCVTAARVSNNYKMVRKAIAELIEHGALHDPETGMGGLSHTEDLNTQSWTIYPSAAVVGEIVEANRHDPKPAERLGLS